MTGTSVVYDIIARDNASRAFRNVANSAAMTQKRLERMSTAMVSAGRTMTHAVTLPVIAIGAESVKMATDFQSAMTKIQTQAGGSAKDVRVLSREVLGLAKTAQQGPVELANSLYHLKSVGLDNAKAMKALKQASDLAAVGGANLEDTTNALAGAWRSGIKGAGNFHVAVKTLNAIIGAGNMRMTDLTDAMGTGFLPAAKSFGLSLKDVGSALALMTDEGVPANAAATRLRMTFSLLGAPSVTAQKQLNLIGLSATSLARDMRKPNGLIVAIGDLKQHMKDTGLTAVQQSQLLSRAFGGGRSSAAILTMINNFGVLKQKQDQVTASMGRFRAAVKAQGQTAGAQFALMVSSLQRAAIIIGKDLLPYAVKAANWVGKMAEKFNAMPKPFQGWAIGAALALAALGPLLMAVGKMIKIYSSLRTLYLALTTEQIALNTAMDANVIGIIVLALAALAAGLIYAYKHSATFRTICQDAFHAVAAAGKWMWNSVLQPVFKFLVDAIAFTMKMWAKMLGALGHIPGFGWAKDASKVMYDAANKASQLGNQIQKIPNHASVTIVDNTAAKIAATQKYQDMLRNLNGSVATTYLRQIVTKGPVAGGGHPVPARAVGGPVLGRHTYLVGERGPELFTPSSGGQITPNNQLGGGDTAAGGVHITINGQDLSDPSATARAVARQMRFAGVGG